MSTVIFGYRHVTGVEPCPCENPGNYLMMEQPGADPLVVIFRCWCGARMPASFESIEERNSFLEANDVEVPA